MTWVGPLVGTQWSATPIDAPLAPFQVPSEKTTQHLEPMAPGRLEPDASTLSFPSRSDGLNDAQTSELGRLSTGKGGLPLWLLTDETSQARSHLSPTFQHLKEEPCRHASSFCILNISPRANTLSHRILPRPPTTFPDFPRLEIQLDAR